MSDINNDKNALHETPTTNIKEEERSPTIPQNLNAMFHAVTDPLRHLRPTENHDPVSSNSNDIFRTPLAVTTEADSGSDADVDADGCSDSDTEGKPTPHSLITSRRAHSSNNAYDGLSQVHASVLNFAMEHRIFLRAILGLLAERDKLATEIGMNDPNTLKCGPLKKASHLVSGVWKVKFVEVRRGMFSYYEDAVSGDKSTGSLLRKNLPLDATFCECRPVKIHRNGLNMAPGGAIFELKVGSTHRLWLAKSKAERLAWIQAINDAMVGGSVTQGNVLEQHGKSGTVNRRSPYQKALRQYLKTKTSLRNANSKSEYVTSLRELLGESLDIPVKWLMEQMDMPSGDPSSATSTTAAAFHESEMTQGIEQLWRDLLRDSVEINKEKFHGDSGHGPEKIMGALTRYIIARSKSTATPTTSPKHRIQEAKAIAYARDILLSVNRTRSGGDSYFCVDTLVKNANLIVTVPSSRQPEPLSITVQADDTEDPTDYSVNDKSGWVLTRNRLQTSTRRRFFVLSEGTLSLYRNATPRPHGLRGQMVVTDASIKVDKSKEHPGYNTIYIETKDGLKDRWLFFKSKDKLLQWAYRLELTAKGTTISNSMLTRLRLRSPKDTKPPSTAAAAPEQQNSNTPPEGQDEVVESMYAHAAQIGVDHDELDDRIARLSAKNSSRVKVAVQATTEYNVVTTDPQGDGGDTWATVSATFLQTFRISDDRIARGEELVRIEVTDCADGVDFAQILDQSTNTVPSPRKKGGRLPRLSI